MEIGQIGSRENERSGIRFLEITEIGEIQELFLFGTMPFNEVYNVRCYSSGGCKGSCSHKTRLSMLHETSSHSPVEVIWTQTSWSSPGWPGAQFVQDGSSLVGCHRNGGIFFQWCPRRSPIHTTETVTWYALNKISRQLYPIIFVHHRLHP